MELAEALAFVASQRGFAGLLSIRLGVGCAIRNLGSSSSVPKHGRQGAFRNLLHGVKRHVQFSL